MRKSYRLFFVIAAVCPGCSETSPGVQRAVVDTLPGGKVVVTNQGNGVWAAGFERPWLLDEDLRIGALGSGGPDEFTRIRDLLTDDDGRIYVLEFAAQEIRVFDRDGAYSHTIGRRGEGPGEFGMAMAMTFSPDGETLWVIDAGNQRYSAFNLEGELLTALSREVQQYGGHPEFMDGRLLDWGLGFPAERPGIIAGGLILHQPISVAADFTSADSMPPIEFRPLTLADGRLPQPFFAPRLVLVPDRRGVIWFTNTGEYSVHGRAPGGDTVLVFKRPADAAAIGGREREFVRQATARRPEMTRLYVDALPPTRPVTIALITDHAGHVYVVPDTEDAPSGSKVDVYRDTGEYLGQMPLPDGVLVNPPELFVALVTPDHLYVVVTDSAGVPFISRSRIVR